MAFKKRKFKRKEKEIVIKRGGKNCLFCRTKKTPYWRDIDSLNGFISPRARILPGSKTGVCAKHQHRLAEAIKHCRHLALLPFITKTT